MTGGDGAQAAHVVQARRGHVWDAGGEEPSQAAGERLVPSPLPAGAAGEGEDGEIGGAGAGCSV